MSEPIVVEQSYPVPAQRVWDAITQKDHMVKWFFKEIEEFEPTVGFETSFIVHLETEDFPHSWKVTEVEPLKKLVYDWTYDWYTGYAFVVWELSENDGSTTLKLTCEGIESFPQDVPQFSRESCLGGWKYFLGESLKAYLSV